MPVPSGSFSPAGWRINSLPLPSYTPWLTYAPDPSGLELCTASSPGGFSYVYDGTPTQATRTLKRELRGYDITIVADLPVNIAQTGYTDILQGSAAAPPLSLYFGPNIGVDLGVNTILALGPAVVAGGNQVIGYGTGVGVQIGEDTADPFEYSYASGMVLGSKNKVSDTVFGTAYGLDSAGIANYGEILLGGGGDKVYGYAQNAAIYQGTGIINWGVIATGTDDARRDLADTITGIGNSCGIYNSTGDAEAVNQPTILTGAGADVIWGQALENNEGIVNDGLVDMGSGDDTYLSTVLFGTATTSYFGGDGVVVMGYGNDRVQGFGTGTFFGDALGEVVLARVKGRTLTNYDSLYVVDGASYTVTATSTEGRFGQTINGFNISDGSSTMTVYGFEGIGTSPGNVTPLVAGTYNYNVPE